MEPINLLKIQFEIREWQNANFPNNRHIDCFLGVVEKVGRIAHIFLKNKNRIKEYAPPINVDLTAMKLVEINNVNAKRALKEEIGHVAIFLMGVCAEHDIDFAETVNQTWLEVRDRDWQRFPYNGVYR